MGYEIERKFLVHGHDWKQGQGTIYRQGYLSTISERTVRVRIAAGQAFLTIKGATIGASRPEYEYELPLADAEELLDHLCARPLIEKRRHRVDYAGLVWEIDEFLHENDGLVLAEVELVRENQPIRRPPPEYSSLFPLWKSNYELR